MLLNIGLTLGPWAKWDSNKIVKPNFACNQAQYPSSSRSVVSVRLYPITCQRPRQLTSYEQTTSSLSLSLARNYDSSYASEIQQVKFSSWIPSQNLNRIIVLENSLLRSISAFIPNHFDPKTWAFVIQLRLGYREVLSMCFGSHDTFLFEFQRNLNFHVLWINQKSRHLIWIHNSFVWGIHYLAFVPLSNHGITF